MPHSTDLLGGMPRPSVLQTNELAIATRASAAATSEDPGSVSRGRTLLYMASIDFESMTSGLPI